MPLCRTAQKGTSLECTDITTAPSHPFLSPPPSSPSNLHNNVHNKNGKSSIHAMIQTTLTDVLGLRVPVVQGGMQVRTIAEGLRSDAANVCTVADGQSTPAFLSSCFDTCRLSSRDGGDSSGLAFPILLLPCPMLVVLAFSRR